MKVQKNLNLPSFKQHLMTQQPRIISNVEEEEDDAGQSNSDSETEKEEEEILHKRRRLNSAASESQHHSRHDSIDNDDDDSGDDNEVVSESNTELRNSAGNGGGVRFSDLGGMEKALHELQASVMLPIRNPELATLLGVKPASGVLLHGPPGCGKTNLAHAIANETGIPFYKISATEVVSSGAGDSEEYIRNLFSEAYRTAPSIVFIDAIALKREDLRAVDGRIVTKLMTCMDESHRPVLPDAAVDAKSNLQIGHVIVIGATNRPDAIDSALRRLGRFELEIFLGPPDENARLEILSFLTRNLRLQGGSFDLLEIARSTSGFVGADLAALVNRADTIALERIVNKTNVDVSSHSLTNKCNEQEKKNLAVFSMADFEVISKS